MAVDRVIDEEFRQTRFVGQLGPVGAAPLVPILRLDPRLESLLQKARFATKIIVLESPGNPEAGDPTSSAVRPDNSRKSGGSSPMRPDLSYRSLLAYRAYLR